MRRPLATLLAALLGCSALLVFEVEPAVACSCEETTTASIDSAAGAIIGSIVSIDDADDRWPEEDAFVATVDVVIDIKGNVADQIFIDSYADDGGNCGTSWRVGDEIGVLLYEGDNGSLGGGGCGEFGRDLADEYSPPAATGGLAELVIVGGENAYRAVAYSSDGQPVAFGFESGSVWQSDLCDDSDTLMELVQDWSSGTTTIAARSLTTFEIVGEIDASGYAIFGIECAAADGSVAIISAKPDTRREEVFDTYRVDASGITLIDEPFTGEPFVPSGDLWPRVTTSNGAIDTQSWMNRVVRFDEPIEITPIQTELPLTEISSGLPAAVPRPTLEPFVPGEEAPPAIEVPVPVGPNVPIGQLPTASGGGLSAGVLAAIAVGLIVIVGVVIAVLKAD